MAGTDTTGVGQRNGHAAEVFAGEFSLAATVDNIFVSFDKFRERKRLAFADRGHHESAGTVFLRQVNSQT